MDSNQLFQSCGLRLLIYHYSLFQSAKDNGSRIFAYHLEFDQGHNGSFIEVYRGSDKYCRVTKLSPGTTYKFRLAASNEFGKRCTYFRLKILLVLIK